MSKDSKSLEFLTQALAEVGFSPAHAQRACLATNLAGVPQAIEWALAHLEEEENPSQAKSDAHLRAPPGNGYVGAGGGYGGEEANYNSGDTGLVVELPDGKLFRLKNPNGRVVEMPNGSVVEMIDGQVVEMSNGQQLEMVDGCLLEIRPATIALDDGETVGHRILDLDLSRQLAGTGGAGHAPHLSSAQPSNAHRGRAEEIQKHEQREEERRRWQMQQRENELKNQEYQLSQQSKEYSGKQQQLEVHQQGLRAQEQELSRQRQLLQKESAAIKKKEQDLEGREAKLERHQAEMNKQREQLRMAEKELKDREEAFRQAQAAAQANGASASSTVRQVRDNASENSDVKDAMENIEAGRIRFQELTLGSLLGSGSFADVYRAEWRMPCAVKKMKGRISKEQMTEFVREGEMMRSLKHPGIVKLLGVCVENGSFYLVQEIVNGYGNLFDFLHKKNQRLTYWQCVQIAIGICDAMAYLHERHIVHRDLKPQNCLLVNDRGEVKLCDFGLARLKNTAFVETVSNTAGTPAYQAPEMLRDEPISEKVDLYGFGIMLWEMYTGKLPWSDKNYHQMIHTVAVRNERPPITPNIPRELVDIIERCWHPMPQKRPLFQELKSTFADLAKRVPQDIPTQQQQSSKHMASSSSQMAAARGAGPNMAQPQVPPAQPGQQQYYMQQQQQQQQQQQRAPGPGMAPPYQGAPQQPVMTGMYGGFQQGW